MKYSRGQASTHALGMHILRWRDLTRKNTATPKVSPTIVILREFSQRGRKNTGGSKSGRTNLRENNKQQTTHRARGSTKKKSKCQVCSKQKPATRNQSTIVFSLRSAPLRSAPTKTENKSTPPTKTDRTHHYKEERVFRLEDLLQPYNIGVIQPADEVQLAAKLLHSRGVLPQRPPATSKLPQIMRCGRMVVQGCCW